MNITRILGKVIPYFIVGVLLVTTSATASMVTYELSNAPAPNNVTPVTVISQPSAPLANTQAASVSQVVRAVTRVAQSAVPAPVAPAVKPVKVAIVPVPIPLPKAAAASLSVFSAADLLSHNTGSSCYVAYNGTVYDLTGNAVWPSCTHHGVSGGKDISSMFPHPTSYFNSIPKIGTFSANNIQVAVNQPVPQTNTQTNQNTQTNTASANVFTAATLATHNNGSSCYVAFNGTVYNMTGNSSWPNCTHHGVTGGIDISAAFPHSTTFFNSISIVGTFSANASQVASNTNTQTNTNNNQTNTQTNTSTTSGGGQTTTPPANVVVVPQPVPVQASTPAPAAIPPDAVVIPQPIPQQ